MEKYLPSIQESMKFAKGSSEIEGEYSPEAIKDHLQAWELARGWSISTSLEKILDCHKVLQSNLRPDIAGQLRNVNVFVGHSMCPVPELVPIMLREWLQDFGNIELFRQSENVEEVIKLSHVKFEKIHPFEDGNGRVGRCILNWQRIMCGLPLFVVEPGESQKEYYKIFQ